MSTIQPKGENVRQAIKWISAERQENPSKKTMTLIEEAGMRFNLSPKEQQFLVSFYEEKSL